MHKNQLRTKYSSMEKYQVFVCKCLKHLIEMFKERVSKESVAALHILRQCYNENSCTAKGFSIIAHYDFTEDAFAPVSSKHYKKCLVSSLGRGLYLAYRGTDLLKTLGRLPEFFSLQLLVKIVPRKQCALQTTQI